jgi:hypothetical protein
MGSTPLGRANLIILYKEVRLYELFYFLLYNNDIIMMYKVTCTEKR